MRVGLVVCLLAGFGLATPAQAADQWAERFAIPFASQIIGVLDGVLTTPPQADGAAVTAVAGLNIGDPILVDATDGTPHAATVTGIDAASHWVTWTPAITGGVTAEQNGFVRSAYGLTYPRQSALDASGRIYTIDSEANRVIVFNSNGTMLWTLGAYGRIYDDAALGLTADDGYGPCTPACTNNPGTMLGQFFLPYGIDVSPDGSTIVVGDSSNQRVLVYHLNPGGSIAATAGSVAGPHFDAYALGSFGTAVGRFSYPSGVSLDPAGRIAVADVGNNRIQVFTPSTTGTIVASDGSHRFTALAFGHFGTGPAGPADIQFFDPNDVEFDRSGTATNGRIVVADTDNHRVQIFSASGAFVTSIQTDVAPSRDPGDFNTPLGVTVDELGRIYVADYQNSRIQILTPSANGSSYGVNDPDSDVFGAEQTPEPVPGEVALLGPSGVAVSGGRLIITELDGSRLKVLTRAALGIDAVVTVDRTTLTLQDPARDTVHVTVRVHNSGAVDLTSVTLSATANYGGTFSSVIPAQVDLAPAGSPADSATFEFDFRVTGLADGSTLHFALSAVGNAGTVITLASRTVDTLVTINQPTGPAITLGTVSVTPTRAGLNQHITVTVPVQNVGGQPLSNVRVTATANPGLLVTTTSNAVLIASLPTHTTQSVTFDYIVTGSASGSSNFVQFDISLTAEDSSGHALPGQPLRATAPAAPGVQIVRDNIAPTLVISLTPGPNPRSLDGKDWYNGSAAPCAAVSCPTPAVLTWPTIRVTAADEVNGSGLQRIGWRMVDTSNQPQSDQAGSCSATSGSVFPSTCAAGPNNTLLWSRTLTGMQSRIVIAFWAEDAAGNGAATINDEVACLALGVAPGVTRISSLVTCVTLFVDVQPPILAQGTITINSDNTEARITFTDGDPISQVSSLTSPDATLVTSGTGSGTLILHGEGTVTAHVTVTDFARNATTFTLPFAGSGQIVLRLDATPPEAFNRLDPAALGQRCTTTIAGKAVGYFCTNKVYSTSSLTGLTTAFAPISVIPLRWGGDFDDGRHDDRNRWDGYRHDWNNDRDDHDWDGGPAELHTYSVTDTFVPASGAAPIQNPNKLTLVEKVSQSGSEARVHVIGFQYQKGTTAGPFIWADWAYKKYDWDKNSDGSLRSLTQIFEVRNGWHRSQVVATYDARRNVTRIDAFGPHRECDDRDHRHYRDDDGDDDITVPGLILLSMTTSSGALKIQFDIHSPAPLPDLAPPVLTLSSSKTVEATGAAGAFVTFAASAVDAIDGVLPVTCTAVSGSAFPLGTTAVGCSATDAAGNITQKSMTITVRDTTRPALTLPGDMTIQATRAAGATVSFTASARDIVDPAVAVVCSPMSGSTFGIGSATVSCSATDDSGNKATGSFKVIVSDTVAPVLTLPSTITVNTSSTSGANVSYTVSAADAISGNRSVSCAPASGSKFKVGTTTVSCSASDSAGNTATGSFSVIVKKN